MSYLRELMAANVEGWPDDPAEQDKEIELVKKNPQYLSDLMKDSVEGYKELSEADQKAELNLALLEHDRVSLAEKQQKLETEQAIASEMAKQTDVPLAEGISPSSIGQSIKSVGTAIVKSFPELANQVFTGIPEVAAKAIGDQELAKYIGQQRAANTAYLNEALPTPPIVPPFEQQVEAGGFGAAAALPFTAAQAIAPMTAKLVATAALTPVIGPVAAGTTVFGGSEIPASVEQMTEMGGDTKPMVALGATKAMLNGLIFSTPITKALGTAAPMKSSLWNFMKKFIGEIPKNAKGFVPAIAVTTAIDKATENFVKEKNLTEGQREAITNALFNAIPMTVGFAGIHAAKAMGGKEPIKEPVKEITTTPEVPVAKTPEPKAPVPKPPVEAPPVAEPKAPEPPKQEVPPTEPKAPVPEVPQEKTQTQEQQDYVKKQFEDLGLVDNGAFPFEGAPTPPVEAPPVAEPKVPEPPKQETPSAGVAVPEPTPPGRVLGGVTNLERYSSPEFLSWAKVQGKEPTPVSFAQFQGREPSRAERLTTKFREIFPLDKAGSSAAISQLINVVNEDPIRDWQQRRGVQSNVETQRLAEKQPLTFEQMIDMPPKTALLAEENTQMINTLAKIAVSIRDANAEFAANPSAENMQKITLLKDLFGTIGRNRMAAATEAARTTQAGVIASKLARENQAYREMAAVLEGEVAEPEKAASAFDKWYELYAASLVSGLQTQGSNIVGNTSHLMTRIPEMAISSVISGGESVYPSEIAGWGFGLLSGMQNSAKATLGALNDIYRSESPVRETYAKLKSVQEQQDFGKYEQGRKAAIPGLVGEAVRTPFAFLSLFDILNKTLVYSAETSREAYRIATQKGLKFGSQEFRDEVNGILADPEQALGVEKGGEFKDMALKAARKMTYAGESGPFVNWLLSSRKLPYGMGNISKVLMPFITVPAQVTKEVMARTPLNFARLGYKYSRGELKGREISNELAKPVLGSIIGATAVMAAMNGYLTGFGPRDRKKRAVWLLNNKPYEIKTKWGNVTYDKLEPLGSIIGMAADMVEMAETEDEKTYGDYAKHFMLSVGSNLANKSFVRGISTLMQAWTDPERYGEGFLGTLATGMVPGGGALNSIRKAVDPYARNTDGIQDTLLNRFPWASETLTPKRDIFGNPVPLGPNVFARSVLPMRITERSLDPAYNWVEKMGVEIGYPSDTITVGGKETKFDPIYYDLLIAMSGKEIYNYINTIRKNIDPAKISFERKEAIKKGLDRDIKNIRRKVAQEIAVKAWKKELENNRK